MEEALDGGRTVGAPLVMPDERLFTINVNHEIDQYFDESSLSREGSPCLVVLMGAPACGKTTFRKERFSTGHVLVDAAEIFLNLSRGKLYEFPKAFEESLQIIGSLVARRAISEKRHIVTEIVGADLEATQALLEAMKAAGYRIDLQLLTCDLEEAQRRNLNREDYRVSSYHAEPFQRSWLQTAATEMLGPDTSG